MSPIDVFDVDKELLWEWAGWQNRHSDDMGVSCEADSLRKGSYVVVTNYSWFGGMQIRPIVWQCFGSLRAALKYIDEVTEGLGYQCHGRVPTDGLGFAEEYEIWHVVEGAYAGMVSPGIPVYDIQVSALCELCKLGNDAYPNAGVGTFNDACPFEGGAYLLVDMVDGIKKPFILRGSDILEDLQRFGDITHTSEGKAVSWEIWRVVEDQPEPEAVPDESVYGGDAVAFLADLLESLALDIIVSCGYVPAAAVM